MLGKNALNFWCGITKKDELVSLKVELLKLEYELYL